MTFRTSAEAHWARARQYASELIQLIAKQHEHDASVVAAPGNVEAEHDSVAKALAKALSERDDLDRYGSAKRTLFALQLTLDLEDIHTVAATALTDGPDDKSCDVVYVDRDARTIVIAQGYESERPRPQAPLSKAASLHQAVNWLLGAQDELTIPLRLRSAWKEVHEALADEAIDDVEIWFVHNLPESSQVSKELNAVAEATYQLLARRYGAHPPAVVGKEVGAETLRSRYEGSRTPILVTDTFIIEASESLVEHGDNWSALCTSIPASWLQEQFGRYKEKLFSANVRGYLGSKRSQSNINNGIRETILHSPRRFWAYNNGITVLVHEFDRTDWFIIVTGLAVVNGAQTTGAIGSAAPEIHGGSLLARFIKCDDAATVQDIIRYNNRQNATEASDFRSNDRVQTRLVQEFRQLKIVGYNGGRRGGSDDIIRRPGENQLSASTAAQALAAFHGRPDVAYHEKGQIWEVDAIYSDVFRERTSARHIVFVYTLLRTIEEHKLQLGNKAEAERTRDDRELLQWLGMRGSTFLAVAATGASIETLLDAAVPDKYALAFTANLTLPAAIENWRPVVTAMLALAPAHLGDVLSGRGLRSRQAVDESLAKFRAIVASTRRVNAPTYATFAGTVGRSFG